MINLVFLLLISSFNCQIHRAVNQNDYHIKYESHLKHETLVNDSIACCNETNEYQTRFQIWLSSIIGALLVGLSGVLPLLVLPQLADDHDKLTESVTFKCLVSFAAGSLLGDIFIHLLPETFTVIVMSNKTEKIICGLWVIIGLLCFFIMEKVFPEPIEQNLHSIKNVGILNLIANVIDNFTHGIAVAGSFQASFKFGLMTLMATLLHEIPHEIGDFVLLLKSGLNYKQAALSQFLTAFGGILGAIFALLFSSAEQAGNLISWILPFTAGGFLYVSLVGILAEVVNEKNSRDSIKQIIFLEFGVFVIYLFS